MLYFPIGNSNPVILEKDELEKVSVNLAFNDSSTRNSKEFQLAIGTGTYNSPVDGAESGMRLLSDSTGNTLESVDSSGVESEKHLLSRSKATVARLSESTSSTAYKFSVTADENRKLTLSGMNFEVKGLSGTNVDYTLRKEGSSNDMATTTGDLTIDGSLVELSSFMRDDVITAGTTTTYVLEISGVDTQANVDRTREVTIEELEYVNDVDGTDSVKVSDYSILPTTATTYSY